MRKGIFIQPKKEPTFPKGQLHAFTSVDKEPIYIEKIKIIDVFNASLSVNNLQRIKIVCNSISALQLALEHDDGFDADFQITIENDKLLILGNLRTCLLCLGHKGFYKHEGITNKIKEVEDKIAQQAFFFSFDEKEKLALYDTNYENAKGKLPIKFSASYPLMMK